jgi:hypothetical protein
MRTRVLTMTGAVAIGALLLLLLLLLLPLLLHLSKPKPLVFASNHGWIPKSGSTSHLFGLGDHDF